MSAYMVDREVVGYLVGCAAMWDMHWHDGKKSRSAAREDEVLTGQMLWDENRRSINARYPDTVENMKDAPGPVGEDYIFKYEDVFLRGAVEAVQVIKSVKCYQYQACEHEGWKESEAKKFADSLLQTAIRKLPGYEAAEWGAPEFMYNRILIERVAI